MGWYFCGEDLIVEETDGTKLKRDLYLDGTNHAPKILLGEDLYGVRSGWNKLVIKRDRYYETAASMRRKIEYDYEFRIGLKNKTKELLHRFSAETDELERQINAGKVDPDWLKSSLEYYGVMLSLLEFNGMISYTWFEQQLGRFSEEEQFFIKDFSYTRVSSHRVYLYAEKIKLLQKLYDCESFAAAPEVDAFMDTCNYLSDKGDPMRWDFQDKKAELCEELTQLREIMTKDAIVKELESIRQNRQHGWEAYNERLCRLNALCLRKGCSVEETTNLLHAVTMISFTFTEEEVRHFYQDRYWVLLNKLIRKLELPHDFVTADWLVQAVRQNGV